MRALEFKHIQKKHLSVDRGNYTFPGSFVRGVHEIRILTRQPYFKVQKGALNVLSLLKITQQRPDKLQNAKCGLFPERALANIRHQIYFVISTDVKSN